MRDDAAGVNVPVPLELQIPDPVVDVPLRETEALFAQTVASVPAFTVGLGVKTTVTLSSSGTHVPLLEEVNTRMTLPAVVSAVPGT